MCYQQLLDQIKVLQQSFWYEIECMAALVPYLYHHHDQLSTFLLTSRWLG
jgi:hypothetical protein